MQAGSRGWEDPLEEGMTTHSDFFFFFLFLPVYCYQPISLHPHACVLSHVISWTAACQAPLSMNFSRQEYWMGCHFLFHHSNIFAWKILDRGT